MFGIFQFAVDGALRMVRQELAAQHLDILGNRRRGAGPLMEGVDTNIFGHQLGLFNREGAGGGTSIDAGSMVQLDYLTITPLVAPPRLTLRVQQVELCWTAVPTTNYQVQYRSPFTTNTRLTPYLYWSAL